MCEIKDTEPHLRGLYCHLFGLVSAQGMPNQWKMARIIPLHKKGDKNVTSNYRPISNLNSVCKFYEKVILHKINEANSTLEGPHLHGFRKNHSTTTAILDLQRIIAKELDNNMRCVIDSVDLSAAFDLLRKNTLDDIIKNDIPISLRAAIHDFFSD